MTRAIVLLSVYLAAVLAHLWIVDATEWWTWSVGAVLVAFSWPAVLLFAFVCELRGWARKA